MTDHTACGCKLCAPEVAGTASPTLQSAPAADFESEMAQLSGSLNLMRRNRTALARALVVTVAGPQGDQG